MHWIDWLVTMKGVEYNSPDGRFYNLFRPRSMIPGIGPDPQQVPASHQNWVEAQQSEA
jgi:hypothetical protein